MGTQCRRKPVTAVSARAAVGTAQALSCALPLPTMTLMTTETPTLLTALETADMLLIDDLHAWQFALDEAALAQVAQGVFADADGLLSIECMDGRTRRVWRFSSVQVRAATFDAPSDSWRIADADGEHRLVCLAAFGGDDSDADEDEQDASNDA